MRVSKARAFQPCRGTVRCQNLSHESGRRHPPSTTGPNPVGKPRQRAGHGPHRRGNAGSVSVRLAGIDRRGGFTGGDQTRPAESDRAFRSTGWTPANPAGAASGYGGRWRHDGGALRRGDPRGETVGPRGIRHERPDGGDAVGTA